MVVAVLIGVYLVILRLVGCLVDDVDQYRLVTLDRDNDLLTLVHRNLPVVVVTRMVGVYLLI